MTDIVWSNVTVTLGQLQPWERNPKSISKTHAKRLLASWDKFGQFQTVAIGPEFEVYDGHQRLSVLRAAYGDGYQVAARQSSRAMTDSERRELVIAAHVGTTGQFNWDELANWDAAELQEWGLDGETLQDWRTGIGALTELIEAAKPEPAEDAGAQIDKAEELREKWGVETGQMWRLGEHRIICGDCTDRAVVERVMGGEKAELAPVDPPYNVGFDYDGSTVDDNKNVQSYEKFSRAWFELCQSVSIRQIVTPGCYNLASWLRWFDAYHWAPWTKSNSMTKGKVSRFLCWEPVLFFGEKWGRHRSNDIFDFPIGKQEGVANHPCPKPLKMWVDLIENYSEPGALIFESFLGSGTTLIACERLSRKCRAVEISPGYVAVAIQRWVDMTGGTPELIQ